MEETNVSSGFIFRSDLKYQEGLTDIKEYRVSREGYSLLYSANKGGKLLILKGLKPLFRDNPVYIGMLYKEYAISYKLDHPNVCKVLSFENLPAIGYCIVMEYIDGLSLREFINKELINSGTAKKIIDELLEGMDYIHRWSIIHRDLKPENILITNQGNHVKIIDFGLSDSDTFERPAAKAGSPFYIAPELLNGRKADERSDIYSIGMIGLELCGIKNIKLPYYYRTTLKKAANQVPASRFSSILTLQSHLKKKHHLLLAFYSAAIIIPLLLALFFITGNRELFPGRSQTITEERDLQGIYYNCYLMIDSTIKTYDLKFRQANREQTPYELAQDSTALLRELSKIIESEYKNYPECNERGKSRKWAEQSLEKWLEKTRKAYSSNSFNTAR